VEGSGSEAHEGVKARAFASYDLDAGGYHAWTARVRGTGGNQATAYARNQTFAVCGQASFKEVDPHPSAVEYLLGALGGDRGGRARSEHFWSPKQSPRFLGRGRRSGPPGFRDDKRHALRERRRR
jgi:hypothetical protein